MFAPMINQIQTSHKHTEFLSSRQCEKAFKDNMCAFIANSLLSSSGQWDRQAGVMAAGSGVRAKL